LLYIVEMRYQSILLIFISIDQEVVA